jgi:hypothetical protein
MESILQDDSPLARAYFEGPLRSQSGAIATQLGRTSANCVGEGKAVDSVMGTPESQNSPTDAEFPPGEMHFAPSAIQTTLRPQRLGQPVRLDMAQQGILSRLWTACVVSKTDTI